LIPELLILNMFFVQSLTLSHFGGKRVYLTERPSLLSDDADDDLLPGINNLLGTL